MNFDRNTVLGFALLALLFGGYFYFTSKDQQALQKQKELQKVKDDSIANANRKNIDTTALFSKDTSGGGQVAQKPPIQKGNFSQTGNGEEELVSVENELMKVVFTTKGGQPKYVELKNFKDQQGKPVKLANGADNKIDYSVKAGDNKTVNIADLNFEKSETVTNTDGSKVIKFMLASDSNGPSIAHTFTIKKDDYMMDFDVKFNGVNQLINNNTLNLNWQYTAAQQEKDIDFEKTNTQIGYVTDGEFDYHTIGRKNSKEFSKPTQWIGVRQRFFNTILVAKNNFKTGKIEWVIPHDSSKTVVKSTANLQVEVPAASEATASFSLFYGPADYRILKKYDMQMGKLINLGQGMYAFVRPINKYIVIPVFDFLAKFAGSMGIAILLLTVFIRLLTSPLMYPGYKTSAQMKILKPDLAKLKEKYPEQQQYAMEQMKFMRAAGVNQFAGCLPGLLQIPIFFALYSYFSASIDLRGHSFLWAKDLSSYDVIWDFGTNIPLLGSHLSLFTITACITSFFISFYSMSMTPDQSNPVMKYMPYFFPIFLLFIFNRLPAALTWYYTVSNIITLGIQIFIQRFVINHDRLLAKMEETRKKPKAKSKWAERMEQMQATQQKVKDMQEKNKKR